MTKVMDWTDNKSTDNKTITFEHTLNEHGFMGTPEEYDNIALVGKSRLKGVEYDLMLAWDDGVETRAIYLGFWNGGNI